MIKLIIKPRAEDFEKEVNRLIEIGWEPLYETFKVNDIVHSEGSDRFYYILMKGNKFMEK